MTDMYSIGFIRGTHLAPFFISRHGATPHNSTSFRHGVPWEVTGERQEHMPSYTQVGGRLTRPLTNSMTIFAAFEKQKELPAGMHHLPVFWFPELPSHFSSGWPVHARWIRAPVESSPGDDDTNGRSGLRNRFRSGFGTSHDRSDRTGNSGIPIPFPRGSSETRERTYRVRRASTYPNKLQKI